MEPEFAARRQIGMTTLPTDRYGLVRRQAALSAGYSDARLSAAIAHGDLIRLIPGVCVPPSDEFDGHEGAQRLHRLRAIAVQTSALRHEGDVLPLTHSSAAAMLGLSLLHPDLRRVHVTTGRTAGGSIRTHRHIHAAPVGAEEIVLVDGIAVTRLERTAIDVATTGNFCQALCALDAALRMGADRSLMAGLLDDRRRRGAGVARSALAFADAASASVGESWSRGQMIEDGLPLPRLQHRFRGASGKVYLTDFDWAELLIGEFDGLQKYGRLHRPGESAADAVVREKIREDDLRTTGAVIVRWTWSVLERRALVVTLNPWLRRFGLRAS
ncbi:hypothetical protein GCM10009624_27630 [Gordonia sinesedis]